MSRMPPTMQHYIYKYFFCYISPIFPEALGEWISTKFGIVGLLADVINYTDFFVDRFRGIDFVGGGEICLFPGPIGIERRR